MSISRLDEDITTKFGGQMHRGYTGRDRLLTLFFIHNYHFLAHKIINNCNGFQAAYMYSIALATTTTSSVCVYYTGVQ